jgi:hypothetical protein
MSENLSWLNDADSHSQNLLESLCLSHLRQFMLITLEYSGNAFTFWSYYVVYYLIFNVDCIKKSRGGI